MGNATSEPLQQQTQLSKSPNEEKRRKFPRWHNIRKRLTRGKGIFRTHDHAKLLRDLVHTWSYQEIVALMEHYKALISLKDSITQSNLVRHHVQPLKNDMRDLLEKELFSDVTLIFKGVKFAAHKAILSSRCTYFQELFSELEKNGNGEDTHTHKDNDTVKSTVTVNIPIDGITEEMFATLLQYLYTGDFPNQTSGHLDMLMHLGEEFGTPNVLEQDLKGLLYSGQYADIILVFQGHHYPDIVKDNSEISETSFEVPCHRAILCARSPYFRSLILNQQRTLPMCHDSGCLRLVIDERVFPQQYARVVLQCIYTDSFDLSSVVKWSSEERKSYGVGPHNLLTMAEIAMEVYEVAKFIEFDVLAQGCEDVLQEELSPSSLLNVLEWSSLPHGSEWVARQTEQYLLEEFTTVVQTETFNKLPKKYLVKILQSDFLQACEHDVLLSVIRWGEAHATKKIQARQDLLQDGKRSLKRSRVFNKAVKRELSGVISHVRMQHVLPLHSELVESAIARGFIDRGMPLDIGQGGSFYPSCPWMRRRHEKDFVKPRLFLSYYDEAKRIVQDYRDTEMHVIQQRMLRLGQSIPDTLYMVRKSSHTRDNSRSITDLGQSIDHSFHNRSRRSNSLSQAECLYPRRSPGYGLPDIASTDLYHDESCFAVQSSPALTYLHKSSFTMPRRSQVCSTTSLPLVLSQIPDVASSSNSSTLSTAVNESVS